MILNHGGVACSSQGLVGRDDVDVSQSALFLHRLSVLDALEVQERYQHCRLGLHCITTWPDCAYESVGDPAVGMISRNWLTPATGPRHTVQQSPHGQLGPDDKIQSRRSGIPMHIIIADRKPPSKTGRRNISNGTVKADSSHPIDQQTPDLPQGKSPHLSLETRASRRQNSIIVTPGPELALRYEIQGPGLLSRSADGSREEESPFFRKSERDRIPLRISFPQ